MEKPHLYPLRSLQFDAFQLRILSNEPNELNEIFLAEQEIVLVEAELPNALAESPFDLGVNILVIPDPHFPAFIEDVGRTVGALEGTATTGGKNRVIGQLRFWLRVTGPVLEIQFQVERKRIRVRNGRRYNQVSHLLLRISQIKLATLQV